MLSKVIATLTALARPDQNPTTDIMKMDDIVSGLNSANASKGQRGWYILDDYPHVAWRGNYYDRRHLYEVRLNEHVLLEHNPKAHYRRRLSYYANVVISVRQHSCVLNYLRTGQWPFYARTRGDAVRISLGVQKRRETRAKGTGIAVVARDAIRNIDKFQLPQPV